MTQISWDMAERFTFPFQYGGVEEIIFVNITPRWEQQELLQSTRLSGIYHIAASVRFAEKANYERPEGVYIEHIDVENDVGYFEYALPLEIDLPSVERGFLTVQVEPIEHQVVDEVCCSCEWTVRCEWTEVISEPVQIEQQPTLQKPQEEMPAAKEVAINDDFFSELAEAYSKLPLNKISR